MVDVDSAPVTLLWAVQGDRLTAFLAGESYLQRHWMRTLQDAAQSARVSLIGVGGRPLAGDPVPADARRVQRGSTDTGLPWTVAVAGTETASAEFAGRRRMLLAGLGAVLVLVIAGSYFIWRSVKRDMTVARLCPP